MFFFISTHLFHVICYWTHTWPDFICHVMAGYIFAAHPRFASGITLHIWECLYTFDLWLMCCTFLTSFHVSPKSPALRRQHIVIYSRLLKFCSILRLQKYEVITRLLKELVPESVYQMFCFKHFSFWEYYSVLFPTEGITCFEFLWNDLSSLNGFIMA